MHVIEVAAGDELLESVARQVKELGVENGAVVSMIGALSSASISNMRASDALVDIVTDYVQPMELCGGSGEIRDGAVHVHVVLGLEGDVARAGHLHRAVVEPNFFARVYLLT